MQRIDYELGLIAHEEDFSGADGKVKAAVCKSQCIARHPFNKGKRTTCKSGCDEKYRSYDEYNTTQVAVNQQMGANSTAMKTSESSNEQEALDRLSALENDSKKAQAGMSMGAKIGIGLGAAILIVGGIYIMKKK
jgi:hypothetical protein